MSSTGHGNPEFSMLFHLELKLGVLAVLFCEDSFIFEGLAFSSLHKELVFATPEAQVGFHPDAGASYYLSQLPGYLGLISCYLLLSQRGILGSNRRKSQWRRNDCLWPCYTLYTECGSSLAQYVDLVYPDKGSVLHRIEKIDKCFGQDTVEEIIDALENEAATNYDEWCTLALKKLKEASPLSLKVSLRSIREGRFQADFNRLINASAESIVCPFVTLPNMSLMISVSGTLLVWIKYQKICLIFILSRSMNLSLNWSYPQRCGSLSSDAYL
ncbi:hypothetical protein IFM89_034727 [Coptis chinensis]|uniref:3-hydroxyisobutyryl-CoA hydrolase n=1 Tax=Coptis chinensis TaxID=261450 RepID=A0A835LKB1_9MAGN|nr:hypothetical protein IFM89_034727 [Coptis chinensis]